MNLYDSVRMQDLLKPFGYENTNLIEEADMIIINTCHIRDKASEKVYSELGRIKKIKDKKESRSSDKVLVVVAGCVAQAEGELIFKRSSCVDIIVGPQSYHTLPLLLTKISESNKQLIELDFIEEKKFDKLPDEVTFQGISSGISIQEGCDKFCTFCVVPYTRGAEFSRPLEQIYREVIKAVSLGAREIVLLGQNVNAYHNKNLDGNNYNLVHLITIISQIKQLERIRYVTSHPIDMTEDLIKLHGTESKLMPFLHLPAQSGSNKILRAMNRKYTREIYLDIILKLRAVRPDIVFSSDFIVGFPGETDKDFEDTLNLIRKVEYGQCYSFKYSPRPGTPSAMKTQVLDSVKSERLKLLQQELQAQQLRYNRNTVGKVLTVLFDKHGKFSNQALGKTPYMQSVYISNNIDENILGKSVQVRITSASLASLSGNLVK